MTKFYKYLNEQKKLKWDDYIKNNKMLASAIEILNKIEEEGNEAYIVGGAVRDILLEEMPHDIDIATNMPIDQIYQKFDEVYDIGKSKSFGIVVIKQNGFDIEVAQFREESYITPKTVREILK